MRRDDVIKYARSEKSKTSRWSIFLHLWGGMCLKAYFEVSGLSKLIFNTLPKGTDPSLASIGAITAGLVTVGVLVIGYALSYLLIKRIEAITLSRKGKRIIKTILPIVYFAGVIFLSMATAPLFVSSAVMTSKVAPDAQISVMDSITPETIAPVKTFTTIQDAEGATEADFDLAGLKNLEAWVVETWTQKSRNKFVEMGGNANDFKSEVVANSAYVTVDGKKLAVIKVNLNKSAWLVTIFGINGMELHRVSCFRYSNHDIPVWSEECGRKVQEVFDVSMQL